MRPLQLLILILWSVPLPLAAQVGLVGSDLSAGTGIREEGRLADGTVMFRLSRGFEPEPDAPSSGYAESELRLRPQLIADQGALRLHLGGSLRRTIDRPPMNFAALAWGFALMDWDDLSKIVTVTGLRLDGRPLERLPGNDLRFPETDLAEVGQIDVDLRLTYFSRHEDVTLPIGRQRHSQVRLRDARIQGSFLTAHAPPTPPFLPYFSVDADGHVVVLVAAESLGMEGTARLRLWTAGTGVGGQTLERTQDLDPERLHEAGPDGVIALYLDELVEGWWALPAVRRRVTVMAGTDDEQSLHARSPWLEPRDQHAALRRRLEAWASELFDLPFAEWWRIRKHDEAAAKRLLWRGVWRHSSAVSCTVTVDHIGTDPAEAVPLTVELQAVESGKPRPLDQRSLMLSGRHTRAGMIAIAPGAHATIRLSPTGLPTAPVELKRALERCEAFQLVATPRLIGNPHPDRLTLTLQPLPWRSSALALGLWMHNAHPQPVIDEPPYDRYEKILDQSLAMGAGAGVLAERTAMERHYARFTALADAHVAQLATLGGTNLDALSILMDGHIASGRLPHFVYDTGVSITSAHGTPGKKTDTVTLTHSTSEVLLAIASAAIVPGLSYADMAPLLAGLDVSAGEATRRTALVLAGRDFWAGTRPTAVNEHDIQRATQALAPLLANGVIRLPPKADDYLRDNNFNSMQGYLFEEMTLDSIARNRVERLNQWAADGERFVLIRGEQIVGTAAGSPALTDGVVIRVDADGARSIWHIINCKSSQSAADGNPPRDKGMPEQMAAELGRLADGFTLRNLTEAQRKELRHDQPTLALNRTSCPVALSERLFIAAVPRDVQPPQRMPAGLDARQQSAIRAGLRRPERLTFSADEVKAATQLVFARNGVVAHAWDEPGLTLRQFRDHVRRIAKARNMDPPDEAVMMERFARGDRLHPTASEPWVAIQPALRWQAPLLGPDEVMAIWAADPKRVPKDKAAAERLVRLGQRFNPDTHRFRDPMAMDSTLRVVDPRNPFEDPEAVVAWMRLHRPGLDPATVRANLADGKIYDPATNDYRALAVEWETVAGQKRAKLDPAIKAFGKRVPFDGTLDLGDGRNNRRAAIAGVAEELAQAAAAGAEEWMKMAGNTMDVLVTTASSTPYASIAVNLTWIDGQRQRRSVGLPAGAARAVIASWYHRHLPDGVEPGWMEHLAD